MNLLRILVIAALQTAALVYMISDRQATLNSARVVTLKVIPVDPRDMFRGDFVILNYEINNLNLGQLDGEDKFETSDTIYVTLMDKGTGWAASAVGHHPVVVPGGIPLRGQVQSVTDADNAQLLRVDYGIESYYVPEGTGHDIEQQRQKGDLSIDVAVDAQGKGAIKAMRRGGQVFYVEGIF